MEEAGEDQQGALPLGGTDRKYVPTQEALAAHLGVNRKSVERWLRKPDCPGKSEHGYDCKAWELFCEKNRLGGTKKARGKGIVALEEEKLRLGNEKQELLNARLRGEAMGIDEVCATLGDMMAGFVLTLRQTIPGIVEEVAGLPLAEANKRMRRRLDEALSTLALGEWAQKKTFWSKVYARLLDLQAMHGLGRGPRTSSGT